MSETALTFDFKHLQHAENLNFLNLSDKIMLSKNVDKEFSNLHLLRCKSHYSMKYYCKLGALLIFHSVWGTGRC